MCDDDSEASICFYLFLQSLQRRQNEGSGKVCEVLCLFWYSLQGKWVSSHLKTEKTTKDFLQLSYSNFDIQLLLSYWYTFHFITQLNLENPIRDQPTTLGRRKMWIIYACSQLWVDWRKWRFSVSIHIGWIWILNGQSYCLLDVKIGMRKMELCMLIFLWFPQVALMSPERTKRLLWE